MGKSNSNDTSKPEFDDLQAPPEVKAQIIEQHFGGFYLPSMIPNLPDEWHDGCKELMQQILDRMAPKDPLERMMCEQMVWCHYRIAALSMRATRTRDFDRMCRVHELVERAMNTYRRGILALKEYRRLVPAAKGGVRKPHQLERPCLEGDSSADDGKKGDERTRGQSWRATSRFEQTVAIGSNGKGTVRKA